MATHAKATACERCGQPFTPPWNNVGRKRFCSRRCQINAYHAWRKATDPVFHAEALEYQRLWRVRERARRYTDWGLPV